MLHQILHQVFRPMVAAVVSFAVMPVASAALKCEPIVKNANLVLETCPESNDVLLARVRYLRSGKSINAEFRESDSSRFWQRLWFADGEPMLTKLEQDQLKLALVASHAMETAPSSTKMGARDRSRMKALALADFLVGFLEPGTRVEPFDRSTQPGARFSAQVPYGVLDYTMICDSIGQSRVASFTANAMSYQLAVIVGTPENNCRGRCGTGCEQWLQSRKRQYTQECLNHDVCRDSTGQQLGECEDEFWSATAGYLMAPDCPADLEPSLPITNASTN